MRLRLIVERHGLPPVNVLWTVRSAVGSQASGLTVSHFLEQVNDVIPLEADHWGLEDYAVELKGFECLHFAELHQVLNEDDEVSIRPLQTSDRRVRKISGRHQISEDGKHLIDGVAFGRPFLRKAARPAIRIPPLKKRRLTYDVDDDSVSEDLEGRRQVVLAASCEDEDEDDGFASEDEDLHDELRDLHEDDVQDRGQSAVAGCRTTVARSSNPRNGLQGLGLLNILDQDGNFSGGLYRSPHEAQDVSPDLVAIVGEEGRMYLQPYHNPLLDEYSQDEPQHSIASRRIGKRRQTRGSQFPRAGKKDNLQDASATPERGTRRGSAGSNKSVRFQDQFQDTPATIREYVDSDDEDDDDFEPNGFVESDKENAPPRAQGEEFMLADSKDTDNDSSSFSESEPSDSDWTSSSGTPLSSSDLETEAGRSGQSPLSETDASSTSSSDISPDSNTDAGHSPVKSAKSNQSFSSSSSSDSDSDSEAERSPKRTDVSPNISVEEVMATNAARPPYMGKKTTRVRNQRRRNRKFAARILKRGGVLPPGAGDDTPRQFRQSNNDAGDDPKPGSAEFESKRQALLDSLSCGGVDVDECKNLQNANFEQHEDSSGTKQAIQTAGPAPDEQFANQLNLHEAINQRPSPPVVQVQDSVGSAAKAARPEPALNDVSQSRSEQKGQSSPAASAIESSRRPKLDLAGSKRMLFGSLGVKNPKTKDDESKLQAKFMQDVRPISRRKSNAGDFAEPSRQVNTNEESWKDKIDLRAVECCHEGIKLSKPPFPFIQRWDPQQQGGYDRSKSKKKTRKKKRKRNDSGYYENQHEDSFNDYTQKNPRRRKHHDPSTVEPQFEDSTMEYAAETQQDDIFVNDVQNHEIRLDCALPDDDTQNIQASNDQLTREAIERAENAVPESPENPIEVLDDDLPEVAEDRSVYKELKKENCKPGTIVAFQQLEMSPEGGWQPTISNHRTAIIDSLEEDNIVNMTLARRNTPQPKRRDHSSTGEKIYGKFEMPDYSDEDNDDPSKISVIFAELIDPLLIRAAESEAPTEGEEENKRKQQQYGRNLSQFDETFLSSDQSNEVQEPHPPRVRDGEVNNRLSEELGSLPDFDAYERGMSFHSDRNELSEARRHSEPTVPLETNLVTTQEVSPRRKLFHEPSPSITSVMSASQPRERTENFTVGSLVAAQPTTQARHDISAIMNDAGWNSSVGSDVKKKFQLRDQDLYSPPSLNTAASRVYTPRPGLIRSRFLELADTPQLPSWWARPSHKRTPRISKTSTPRKRSRLSATSGLFLTQSPSPLNNRLSKSNSTPNYWDRTPSSKQTQWFGLEVRNVKFDLNFFLPALRAAGLDTRPKEIEFHGSQDAITIWLKSFHERAMVRAVLTMYKPQGREENQLILQDAGPSLTPEFLPTRPIPVGKVNFPNIVRKLRELVEQRSPEPASSPLRPASDPIEPATAEPASDPASDLTSDSLMDPTSKTVLSRKKIVLPKSLTAAQNKWYGLAIGNIAFDRKYFLPALHAGGLDTKPEEVQFHFKKDLITIWFQTPAQRKAVREILRDNCGDSRHGTWLWVSNSGCDGTPPEVPFRPIKKRKVYRKKFIAKLSELINVSDKESSSSPEEDTSVEYPKIPQLDGDSELYLDQGVRGGSSSFAINFSDQMLNTISPPSLRGRDQPASLSPRSKSSSKVYSTASSQQSSHTKPPARPRGPFRDSDSESDEFPEIFSQKFEQRLSQSTFVKAEQLSQEGNNSSAPKKPTKKKTTATAKATASPTNRAAPQRSSNQSSLNNLKVEDTSLQSLPPWQSSQLPQSSAFVDLTISSDPFEVPDDEHENGDDSYRPSSSLPNGSGWIEKPSAKKASNRVFTGSVIRKM